MRLCDMNEPKMKAMLNDVAAGITHKIMANGVDKPLFALLIFDDPKIAQYVSNCERKCMIEALRETADRLERNEVITR